MAAAVGTARVTFPMVVVMITPDIGVEVQLACCQCFYCCISVAGNTTIKPDTHIAQCHLGTAANTAADQGIHLQCTQDACQCTMSAAASIHNLRRNDFSIFHIVDFKLFGVTEVLKDFSVFVSNCNSHDVFSFWLCVLLIEFLFIAVGASAALAVSAAELIVSAFDPQRKAVHQHIRQLFSGAGVDLLDRGAGHLHEIAALFLGESLFVDEADGLVLIHRQDNCLFSVFTVFRQKVSVWG